MKKFLLILGIILIIFIIAGIVYCPKIVNYAIEKGFEAMENSVMASLPDSSSKAEAKIIFDKTITKIKEGEIEKQQLQGLMTTFQSSFKDQKLDSTEVRKIMNDLKILSKSDLHTE